MSPLRFDSSSFTVSNLVFVNVPEPAKISNPNSSYANFSNFSLFFAGTGTRNSESEDLIFCGHDSMI